MNIYTLYTIGVNRKKTAVYKRNICCKWRWWI